VGQPFRFVIRDRDTKSCPAFDTVFKAEDLEMVRTPVRSPRANAVAERWTRSVREECLDHLLILSERHLERVIRSYVAYYNQRRPHQGLDQQCPVSFTPLAGWGIIVRHDVLGGLIHDYERHAA
jgi:transposase InsO family protein